MVREGGKPELLIGHIFPHENLLSFLQEACSIPILGEGIGNQCQFFDPADGTHSSLPDTAESFSVNRG